MATKRRDKIFIVHGRDEKVRCAVGDFLRGLEKEPLVLAELPSGGRTIVEKFEHYAKDAKYAVVLLTPDDVGGPQSSEAVRARARQNVIFELGYFIGRLGRGRVCLMCTPDLELPSDLSGVVYVPIDSENQWGWALVHEFLHARIALDVGSVARSCASLLSRL
jgi:predicted nucleotide-binding protein